MYGYDGYVLKTQLQTWFWYHFHGLADIKKYLETSDLGHLYCSMCLAWPLSVAQLSVCVCVGLVTTKFSVFHLQHNKAVVHPKETCNVYMPLVAKCFWILNVQYTSDKMKYC